MLKPPFDPRKDSRPLYDLTTLLVMPGFSRSLVRKLNRFI